MSKKSISGWLSVLVALLLGVGASQPAVAQVGGPDLTVCDGIDACEVPGSLCDAGGFTMSLTDYIPASGGTSGVATYVYTVCAPAANGICSNSGAACQDHSDCWTNRCQTGGPDKGTCDQDDTTPCASDKDCNSATCSGDCRVDKFQDLSHTDIAFPALGGVGSCLTETTQVTVSCHSPSRGDYAGTIGDGSCFSSDAPVAKCDSPGLAAGQCLTVTLTIAGELNAPGLGAAIAVDKPANRCESVCVAGPSCDPCVGPPPPGDECLTRTIGFWGNHPWITNDFAPVTVCGKTLGCSGASDGKSNPTCLAGTCDSVVEGLCSIGGEDSSQSAYTAMVKQLTAAKLNLNATAALFDGASCGAWTSGGRSIQQWISYCEGLCSKSKAMISNSGCIEALDAFNRSEDGSLVVTPPPFDQPAVDDFGNTSGADPRQCGLAQGNNGALKLLIGKKVKQGANCE